MGLCGKHEAHIYRPVQFVKTTTGYEDSDEEESTVGKMPPSSDSDDSDDE